MTRSVNGPGWSREAQLASIEARRRKARAKLGSGISRRPLPTNPILTGSLIREESPQPGDGEYTAAARALNRRRGYDGLPTVALGTELNSLVRTDSPELFRGVMEPEYAEAFKRGDFWIGGGVFGTGTYVALPAQINTYMSTTPFDLAVSYANSYPLGPVTANDPRMMRMVMKPDAMVYTDFNAFEDEIEKTLQSVDELAESLSGTDDYEDIAALRNALRDEGVAGAYLGIDAQLDPASPAGTIYNRTAVVVQDAPAVRPQ